TTGGKSSPAWHAHDRPQLLRGFEYRPERTAQCYLHFTIPSSGPRGNVVAERCHWSCHSCRSTASPSRNLILCQRREQSRCLRERSVAILGGRSCYRCDSSLHGILWQSSPLRTHRAASESSQTDHHRQSRAHPVGASCGWVSYGSPRS